MELAILGTDPDILQLAAAARSEGHEIVWLGDVRPQDVATTTDFATGSTVRGHEWELLLDRATASAVLVGHGTVSTEELAARVKRLSTEGMPLLVAFPLFDSVLQYYEVDMNRREYGAIVQHFNPLVGHPATDEIADWVRSGHPAIGPIHQLSCERKLATPAREKVLNHLARDVELLARIAGDIRRVTAIGPALDSPSFAALQIQMNAAAAASLRWSVGYATAGGAGLEMALHGERGIVVIRILDESGGAPPIWQVETNESGKPDTEALASYDPAHAAITRLSSVVSTAQTAADRITASTWDSATRAMEVVDAAELSLQKGRTIEVFQQQLTERLAFRGTMAAMGCGVLLVAFFVLIIVGVVGGLEGLDRKQLVGPWSIILLAVLAFFLSLQAVPFLAGKSSRDHAATQAPSSNDRKR
jgi:hypothetical protein